MDFIIKSAFWHKLVPKYYGIIMFQDKDLKVSKHTHFYTIA